MSVKNIQILSEKERKVMLRVLTSERFKKDIETIYNYSEVTHSSGTVIVTSFGRVSITFKLIDSHYNGKEL